MSLIQQFRMWLQNLGMKKPSDVFVEDEQYYIGQMNCIKEEQESEGQLQVSCKMGPEPNYYEETSAYYNDPLMQFACDFHNYNQFQNYQEAQYSPSEEPRPSDDSLELLQVCAQEDQVKIEKKFNFLKQDQQLYFEQAIKEKTEQFLNIHFDSMFDMVQYRKRLFFEKQTKILIDWKEIGSQFGLSQKAAHCWFDSIENNLLQKWPEHILNEIKEKALQLFIKGQTKKQIKELLKKEYGKQLITFKSKQFDNIIDYTIKSNKQLGKY